MFFFFFIFTLFQSEIFAENRGCKIIIKNNLNKSIPLVIEIADTQEKRGRGLMFRKKLMKNNGMLFVFNRELRLNFWMKNTYIPLSIAYINRQGIINEIYHMKPLDTSITYPSRFLAKYALEVNKGWFKKNNIFKGCGIMLNGCLGK